MSAAPGHTLQAICQQFGSSLVAYESDLAALLTAPQDPELYARLGAHMDRMRMYASALPSLSVAWVELMIRHFELTHGVRRIQQHGAGAVDLELVRTQIGFAIAHLTRKCAQLQPLAK